VGIAGLVEPLGAEQEIEELRAFCKDRHVDLERHPSR